MLSQKSPSHYSFIPLLILLSAGHFLVDTMLGIWPVYKSMTEMHVGTAGLIVAVGAFIGEGSQLFFGSLSDRGYSKSLIVFGLIIATASSFLVYFSHYGILFLLYLLTCIGSGCFHPCAARLVTGFVPSRRNLLMTIFASVGSLGMATSQLSFTQVHKIFEEQVYLLACPGIVLALLFACYHFPVNKNNKAYPITKTPYRDFLSFFKHPALRSLYISQVANQSILWGTIFILPDVLKNLGHVEWVCLGGGHFFLILGAACMMIPGGYLADLYSARIVMLLGGVLSCILFYILAFFGAISITFLLPILFMLGATVALMNPLAVSLGTQYQPDKAGAISAFLMGLVWCLSEAIGPGGVGLISSLFTDDGPLKAFALLGSLFFVQLYFTISLPKTHAVPIYAQEA